MTSMTPDWTTAASMSQRMRTKRRRSQSEISDATGSVAALCLVQKRPYIVAETPHRKAFQSMGSMPADRAIYR